MKFKNNFNRINLIFFLTLIYIFFYFSSEYNTVCLISKKAKITSTQIYTKDEVTPIKIFLELIASDKNPTFCLKRSVGKPTGYKSYKCPTNMKIYDFNTIQCVEDCPYNFSMEKDKCVENCRDGFAREYDLCANKSTKEAYKPNFSIFKKSDPICNKGYFSKGLCYTCLGNSEQIEGECLTLCYSGSPSDNYCSYSDESNRNLSLINDFWSRFFRSLYSDLLTIIKTNQNTLSLFANSNTIKDMKEVFLRNKSSQNVQILSARVLIYLRDKFKININDSTLSFLRSIYLKLLNRYDSSKAKGSNYILSVVDDILLFKGDHTSPFLDNKTYGLDSLSETVANFLDHLC